MIQPLHASQPLFPAQWSHEKGGHDGKGGVCAWAQWYRLLLNKADVVSDECPIAEANTESLIQYYSHGGTRYLVVVTSQSRKSVSCTEL